MIWRLLYRILLFIGLTITTQVGGIVYAVYYPLGQLIRKRQSKQRTQLLLRVLAFALLMSFNSLLITPAIAKHFGRVPLPVFGQETQLLKAGSCFFILANRHYVKPRLKTILLDAAKDLSSKHPGAQLVYLDAGFPFLTGFPLLPHRSHDDGEKADLAFVYQEAGSQTFQNRTATLLGYGFFEAPKSKENNTPERCRKNGYWQYSLLGKFATAHNDFQFATTANTALLKQLARDKRLGKIFIEPHLKSRLGLHQFSKIRFHGCQAVRHDDHIHVQL